jgi:Tol biopolymer transport system component
LIKRHPAVFVAALLVVMAAVATTLYYGWRGAETALPADPGSGAPHSVQALTRSGDASVGVTSADGKFLAYVRRIGTDDTVWVRQLPDGVEAQRVAAVPGRRYIGLTISPAGEIDLVTRDGTGQTPGLSRVSLVGTSPPRGIATDVWSATEWAPDGARFAFIRANFPRLESFLVVAAADGSNQRVLTSRKGVPGFSSAQFVPVPTGRPSWSRDGRRLMAVANVADPARAGRPWDLIVVDAATGTELQVIPLPDTQFDSIAWLDDSRALLSMDGAQLSTVDLVSGQVIPLTSDLSEYRAITMLADGRTAAATRTDRRSAIWIGEADGSNMTEVVAESPAQPSNVSIALDGTFVYAANTGSGQSIFVARPGQVPTIIVRDANSPVVTPDGRTVLFRRSLIAGGGIWRANADGSDAKRVVDAVVLHGPTLVPPSGTRFVYTVREVRNRPIMMMPVAGGEPQQVTTDLIHASLAPFVSPDGRRIRFRVAAPDDRTYMVECELPACANPRREPVQPNRLVSGRAWTPDGRRIANVEGHDPANIWLGTSAGDPIRKLTNFVDREIIDLAWSPDGKRLAVTRRSVQSDVVFVKGIR